MKASVQAKCHNMVLENQDNSWIESIPIGHALELKDLSMSNTNAKATKDKKFPSAANDEVDSIYKEEDPIEASIGQRKKRGGRITAVTRDNASRLPNKFFFTLSLKSANDEAEKPSKSGAKRTADKSATFSEEQAKKAAANSRHRRNASMHPATQQDLNAASVSGSTNQSPGESLNQSVLLNQTAQTA